MFEALSSLAQLEQGWEKVRRNAGAPGGDGVSVRDYQDDLAVRLLRLQRDLRAGTYVPGPVRRLQVPKRSGGTRTLSIPCVNDRVVQSAAALMLGPLLDREMEDSSFGYRPNRSVRMAVDRVALHRRAGYVWVVDGDIERYFDSVPHALLLDRLERSVTDPMVLDLVAVWLESFSPDGAGLPQGAPISPLLANLYLDDIDERIADRGVRLVRFADDFLLMCKSEAVAGQALARMRDLLAEYGLALNPEKTRIVRFEQGFRFLGHLFVKSLVLKELRDPTEEPLADAPALLGELAPGPEDDDLPLPGGNGGARSPGLRVLYITEPGRRLEVVDRAFSVTEDGQELLAVPHRRVDRIELGPQATASDAALRHVVATGTALAWVDGWGGTQGVIEGDPWRRARLHLDQARHVLDADLRVDLARRFVDGRLRNQRALLRRLNRRRKDPDIDRALVTIGRCIRKLPVGFDVPTLMGIEGEAGAAFWPALGRTLEHGWAIRTRRRRPPPDPVNLCLSFLAGLLSRDLLALVQRRGLHPGFGFLHAGQDREEACIYDLIEEFRAPLVEGLTVYLFNNRILSAEMFERTSDGLCRVVPDGRRRMIRTYEAWLDRPVKDPVSGDSVVWRRLLDGQVLALAAHVRGDAPYKPYLMAY